MTNLPEAAVQPVPRTDMMRSLFRGLRRSCPQCGKSNAFRTYLKQVDSCGQCAAELGQIRADDLPPYFTIFLVGHIIVPLILLVEKLYEPAQWLQMLVWPSATLLLTLLLLPYIKGGVLGIMWSLHMKGDEQH